MYCRKCGKFVYEGGDLCADCRRKLEPAIQVKISVPGKELAVGSIVVGAGSFLFVWLPYLFSTLLEKVVADIVQNGYGENNMGVTGLLFIFTILFVFISLGPAIASGALGVVSIVSSVGGRAEFGKRIVVPIVLCVIGFLFAISTLVVCGVVIQKLIVLFA